MRDLVADAGLVAAVDQQRAGGERGGRAGREGGLRQWGGWGGDGVQQVAGVGDLVVGGGGVRGEFGDGPRDAVGEGDLAVELVVVAAGNGPQRATDETSEVPGQVLVRVGRIERAVMDE